MIAASISRRTLVAGSGAAVAAMAVPASIVEALTAEAPSTGAAAASPLIFDPAAFVADLAAAGYGIAACGLVEQLGCLAEAPSYAIIPRPGRGFGRSYTSVMSCWADAMDGCPDHVEQVVDHMLGQSRRAA